MSTARERQLKRTNRRQASEAQREKGRQRSRARDKKQRRHFFVGRTWRFCSGGDKIRNASGHQRKVNMSGSDKKVNENTYDISSIKRVTKKFLQVFTFYSCKTTEKKCTKKVCYTCKVAFLLIWVEVYALDLLLFFTVNRRCLRRLPLHHFIFCLKKL